MKKQKKIFNIGESPLPFDNLSYGNRSKRNISDDDDDFSDYDFDVKKKVKDFRYFNK